MFDLKLDVNNSVAQYLSESRDQLAIAEANVLAIEEEGENVNDERVNRVVAALHKVRDGSEIFDLVKIGGLARLMENVLALIRSRKIVPTSDLIRTLLRAIDRMNGLIENCETSNHADTSELIAELANLADNRTPIVKNVCVGGSKAYPAKGPLRMLLVDDDFSCRLLLQTFLCRYGECHAAVNGSEAVKAFGAGLDQGRGYDLVCMDVLMPKMNGRDAVLQIRALERAQGVLPSQGATIFITSSVAEVRQVIQSFEELCDAYLMKPIDLTQLLGKMKLHELIP